MRLFALLVAVVSTVPGLVERSRLKRLQSALRNVSALDGIGYTPCQVFDRLGTP